MCKPMFVKWIYPKEALKPSNKVHDLPRTTPKLKWSAQHIYKERPGAIVDIPLR